MPTKQYIKKLNGFYIKDEEAQQGVSELRSETETIKLNAKKNQIIFMPVSNTISADTAAGDCSVIKTRSGKIIMIDTGASHSYDLIRAELQKNDIEKIDYMIISHFHGDHTSNIASLAEDFDMSSTVYYLPKHTDAPQDITPNSESSVLAVAGENTIIRPDSGDTLIVDDNTITFFNCDQADIDYYDSIESYYNNYSMLCYVECGTNTFLFTGDMTDQAAERLYSQGWFKKVDVEKVEHHGVMYGVGGLSDYNLSTNPDFGVVSASAGMYPLVAFNSSQSMALKNAQGTKIIGAMGEAVYLYYDEKGYSLTDGREIFANINRSDTKALIYVDSSYTGVSDGTSAKPFKNLLAALGYTRKFKGIQVEINVVGSYVSEEEIRLFYLPTYVSIKGDITIKNLTIHGGHLFFDGTVIATDTIDQTVAIVESTVRFGTLQISGDTTSAENDGRGLRIERSSVRIGTLSISNRKLAFGLYRAASVQIDTINGSNNTYGYVFAEGSRMEVGAWAAGFATNREHKARYYGSASKSPFMHLSPDAIEKITNGADLNDYDVPGVYMSQTGAITSSLLHTPSGIGYAFNLKVEYLNGTNNLLQTIVSGNLDHTNTGIYVRVFDQSLQVWSAWQTVVNGVAQA